ncbi:hypothetical protein N7475_004797 [Penicillium sp. IBT 31633x]|nr:hypothetical protein N7475_004797 [Penicillium sp. IBT 31633x]
MASRRRRPLLSPYVPGYSPQVVDALIRMPIPNEIKCCVCKRRRPKSQYSNNQLNYLRQALFDFGYSTIRNQSVAKCGPCTNAQVCEEMCHRCGHYRAIDQFARNQRNRDTPICQPCMNYQLSLDPNDQPLAIEDKTESAHDDEEEEEPNSETVAFSDSGSLSQLEGQSSGSLDQTLETALILRDDYLELEAEEKNSGGFARVRAHRSRKAPVPEPEPAPGWAPGTRKVDDGKPFRGGRFL